MTPQLLAGARTLVLINGSEYRPAYTLQARLSTPSYEVRTVDVPLPAELCPAPISVKLTLGIYRTPDNDVGRQGIAPVVDLAGPTYVEASYTEYSYLSVEFRDKATDSVILFVPRARIDDRAISGNAESLFTEVLSISGIGFSSNTAQSGLVQSLGNLVTGR